MGDSQFSGTVLVSTILVWNIQASKVQGPDPHLYLHVHALRISMWKLDPSDLFPLLVDVYFGQKQVDLFAAIMSGSTHIAAWPLRDFRSTRSMTLKLALWLGA